MIITFFVIALAVALGVSWGLKIHENPEGFSESIKTLFRIVWLFILFVVIPVVAIIGIILLIRWLIRNEYLEDIGNWIGGIMLVGLVIGAVYFGIVAIKDKINFIKKKTKRDLSLKEIIKYLIQEKKEKKLSKRAEKERIIANMSKKELEKHKKQRKDIIIIIICLTLVLAPGIILGILNLFGANI